MSNSTTLLDTIATNQSNKEVVVNALLDAASPATLWGRHASACSGLTWGYYGGTYYEGGTANAVANGTVVLTASTTNYAYADATTGAVSVNTTGFPLGSIPLYSIVTGTTTVTSYTDERSYRPSAIASTGTVTSVGLTAPAQFSVTGSPVTGSGTLALSWANQTANYVFAGPASGSAAAPTFRQLVGADIPVFGASGSSHSQGGVPDPGASAGTTRYLREDGTWAAPTGSGSLAGDSDVSIASPANNQLLAYVTSAVKWQNVAWPVDLITFYPGAPTASAKVMQAITPQATTFPASLTGSYAKAGTAATLSTTFSITQNGTSIGSINFAASATTGTFTFSSAVTTSAGDVIAVVAPGTPDATLADVSVALVGSRA